MQFILPQMGVRWLPVAKRVSKSRDIALHVFVTWNYIRLPLSRHHKKVFLQHASLPRASIALYRNSASPHLNYPLLQFSPPHQYFPLKKSCFPNKKKEIPLGISNPCDNLYVHIHIRLHVPLVFSLLNTTSYTFDKFLLLAEEEDNCRNSHNRYA